MTSLRELHEAPESLFWYWIAERHAIYLRREAGLPRPWTDDPILQTYKFTNPFRENDRGTVWLRDNFLRPYANVDDRLLAFNICWYRMFNWWGTGELLGWQTSWNPGEVTALLAAALNRGEQVFTGAHIVYSRPGLSKVDAIVKVCGDLYKICQAAASQWREVKSLEYTFNDLIEVDSVGGFMAYEMVTDMRHTRLLQDATDIMTWANPGPGAKRGLQRLGMDWKPDGAAIRSMQDLLCHGQEMTILRGEHIGRYPEPVLEMRDIEHSLCEFDKYCRVKFGEGEPRSKYAGS